MKKAKVFATYINGITTQIKAFLKENAVREFQKLDKDITSTDVYWLKNAKNSHQAACDENYYRDLD